MHRAVCPPCQFDKSLNDEVRQFWFAVPVMVFTVSLDIHPKSLPHGQGLGRSAEAYAPALGLEALSSGVWGERTEQSLTRDEALPQSYLSDKITQLLYDALMSPGLESLASATMFFHSDSVFSYSVYLRRLLLIPKHPDGQNNRRKPQLRIPRAR